MCNIEEKHETMHSNLCTHVTFHLRTSSHEQLMHVCIFLNTNFFIGHEIFEDRIEIVLRKYSQGFDIGPSRKQIAGK